MAVPQRIIVRLESPCNQVPVRAYLPPAYRSLRTGDHRHGLPGGRRRRHGQRGPRDAEYPRGSGLPRGRHPCVGLAQIHRPWKSRSARRSLKCKDIDTFDFSQASTSCLMSRLGRLLQGVVAEDRQAGPGGDRQLLRLVHRPGRAPDRARGEPGGRRRLPQEGHHRQSELFDRVQLVDGAEAPA